MTDPRRTRTTLPRSARARGAALAAALAATLAACSAPATGSPGTPSPSPTTPAETTQTYNSADCSFAAPTLEFDAGQVSPGDEITVTGAGWLQQCRDAEFADQGDDVLNPSWETVTLGFTQRDRTQELVTVEPVDGAFEVTVTVPQDAEPGLAFLTEGSQGDAGWDNLKRFGTQRLVVLGSDGLVPTEATPACVERGIVSHDGHVRPGQTITVNGAGFTDACEDTGMYPPDTGPERFRALTGVEIRLFPAPTASGQILDKRLAEEGLVLGTVDADANGEFAAQVTLPADLAPQAYFLTTNRHILEPDDYGRITATTVQVVGD